MKALTLVLLSLVAPNAQASYRLRCGEEVKAAAEKYVAKWGRITPDKKLTHATMDNYFVVSVWVEEASKVRGFTAKVTLESKGDDPCAIDEVRFAEGDE